MFCEKLVVFDDVILHSFMYHDIEFAELFDIEAVGERVENSLVLST